MDYSFIGLGQMGCHMAMNMGRKLDGSLHVFDVRHDRFAEFAAEDIPASDQIPQAARSELIFLSLPNTKVVEQICLGPDGLITHMERGACLVDLSTIHYSSVLRLGAACAERGVDFLDAPVSGMEQRAKEGTLTVMCGGGEAVFSRIVPWFAAISTKHLYMGPLGSGQLAKLINQVLFDINCAALAEILPLSAVMGLDAEKVGEIVNSGTGRSYASEFFIPRILERRFCDGYTMGSAYKDLVSASELAMEQQIPLPVLSAATATYQQALRKGYGAEDKGGMIHVFEELLGVRFERIAQIDQ